jgi:hypothetical protein
MPTSYRLISTSAIAAATPTALPQDCPPFAKLLSVRAITNGEGSGAAAPVANPVVAIVKNVAVMPGTPGATEFDFDTATFQWQYGTASGPQAAGNLGFELQGLLQGEAPVLS